MKTGTAAAFVTTKEAPDINQPTIDYVADYVPDSSGENFKPHVTIGVAPPDDLKKMLEEKFESFTFSPVGAAVYHLGNFGTAQKKLKTWESAPRGHSHRRLRYRGHRRSAHVQVCRTPEWRRRCWRARTAGVRQAPRHEIAGVRQPRW